MGMDYKVDRLTSALKIHDSALYCTRSGSGMIHVRRKAMKIGDCDFDVELGPSGPPSYLLFSLTHDWTARGTPIDWGIEPVLNKIKSMDTHSSHFNFNGMRERREALERDKARQNRNQLRAVAADMRRDFAKATNDVNTSSLKKIDKRREKDGYYK